MAVALLVQHQGDSHNVAGILLRNLAVPALLTLRAWSRRAEVTCDRAGALCAGEIEPSLRALTIASRIASRVSGFRIALPP